MSTQSLNKKNSIMSFDFWQKFGKALLVVIAVMPAAGLMVSIGKLIGMSSSAEFVTTIARVVEDLGWGIIGNLHILFAVAIGGSWAKDRAGGAFAALIAFILINRVTGAIFGVNGDMLLDPSQTVTSLTGSTLLVKDYFTSILGSPALNMGVFVGIISGFLGAVLYNKYYNFDKLPQALAFFNGKRFVPFVVILGSVVTALILSIVWPFVQGALNSFGIWIASSKDSAPILAPFVYGTLERLLLPFGLHHMITVPMNYTELGGVYNIATGAAAGTVVAGIVMASPVAGFLPDLSARSRELNLAKLGRVTSFPSATAPTMVSRSASTTASVATFVCPDFSATKVTKSFLPKFSLIYNLQSFSSTKHFI